MNEMNDPFLGSGTDDDLSLPQAAVNKFIKETIPNLRVESLTANIPRVSNSIPDRVSRIGISHSPDWSTLSSPFFPMILTRAIVHLDL